MEQLLEWMEIIEDVRQHRKVRHSIKDILIIVQYAKFMYTLQLCKKMHVYRGRMQE